MRIEQAVFTSARTTRAAGYHLVAQSAGIDGVLASELTKWGPSHASLIDDSLHACSVSFFPVTNDHVVVARTVYGGPEYSNRGSLQVVTRMLVLTSQHMRSYQQNPMHVIRTALSLGYLHGLPDDRENLPAIQLPDRPVAELPPAELTANEQAACDQVVRQLRERSQVALLGVSAPLRLLGALIERTGTGTGTGTGTRRRGDLSFTTGLRPSALRPFRLHLFHTARKPLRQQLVALSIECLTLDA